MYKLFVDLDGTVNNFWVRFVRCTKAGVTPFSFEEMIQDAPQPGVVGLLHALSFDFDISYLTARGGWDSEGTFSRVWLSNNNFPERDVIIVKTLRDKIAVLDREKPLVFVDDFCGGHENWPKVTFHGEIVEEIEKLGVNVVVAWRKTWIEIYSEILGSIPND